jgi:Uncharacterized protein conserved in bacteria
MPIQALVFALSLLMFNGCGAQGPATPTAEPPTPTAGHFPYDIQSPTLTINLATPELKELSGLSPTDSAGIFLAIADERGEVFFIDGNGGGAVVKRILFREKGDFEGIEMVGKSIWAIKSDGDLFELKDWEGQPPTVETYKTPLKKTDDIEGLAYDPKRNALLLASKSDPKNVAPRMLYAFDLAEKKLMPEPVYFIHPEEVNDLVPYTDQEKRDAFSPSGVAIHPLTGDIYVISTALKRLVVVDYDKGRIKHAVRLDKKLMPQPEGISFDRAGNLYIGSEGKGNDGLLLRFDFKQKN